MKRLLSLALALAASTAAAPAQTTPPAPIVERPFTASMSAAIDAIAQREIAAKRTPGLAIGVVDDGRLVYARGFGRANIGRGTRVAPDTEFYAGDLTLQFTAAAALILAQDGKLKLDDRAVKYLPELGAVAPNVTVAQLLQQTSGLPAIAALPSALADPTRSVKMADLLAAVDAAKPSAPPGTAYAANPLNGILAGEIVARAGGEPLSDVLQERIFVPLVMDRTFLAGDIGIAASHAAGYTHGGSAQNPFVPAHPWDPAWMLGARGLVSTIYDLSKWDIEMPILLRTDAVRTMFTPPDLGAAAASQPQYGMGWVIDRRGGKRYAWYSGEVPGYRAANALLPEDHLAAIVLSNADDLHGGRVTDPAEIAAHILDVVAPPSAARLDNTIVARAREWLGRLAQKQIDRTQLTPAFSTYLSDDLVSRSNFASFGKLETIVPISSTTESNGDTLYEFIVRYPHDVFHYKFAVTADGKIDELLLVD